MNKLHYLTLLLLFPITLFSQTFRIPVPVGNKYKVIDENENQILKPEYDDVIIYQDFNLIALQKTNLWGIYTMDGEKIIEHVIKDNYPRSKKGPTISKAFPDMVVNYKTVELNNSLLSIKDNYANVVYYLNLKYLKPTFIPYAVNVKSEQVNPFYKYKVDNAFRVGKRDNKIIFIDTLGKELIKEPVTAGYPLTNDLFAIHNGKNYALFNKNNKKTDFIFSSINQLEVKGIIVGKESILNEEGGKETLYSFFNDKGDFLFSSNKNQISTETHFLLNNLNGFILFDNLLNEILVSETGYGSFIKTESKSYLVINDNKRCSLFNLNGEKILDTIYQSIAFKNDFWHLESNNSFSILDSNFQLIIQMNGVQYLNKVKDENWFEFGEKESWYTLHGLINDNKEILLKPVYKEIKLIQCDSLVVLKTDSLFILKKVGEENSIFEIDRKTHPKLTNIFQIGFDCKRKIISFRSDNSYEFYDLEGHKIHNRLFNRNQGLNDSSKYNVKKIHNRKQLFSIDNYPVDPLFYHEIEIITNLDTDESVYVCQYEEDIYSKDIKLPNTITYDYNLNVVTPEGYSVPNRWIGKIKKNNGTLWVVNNSDVNKNKNNFRLGLVDFKGNWLIEPIYATLQFIEKNLFIIIENNTGESKLFNNSGKLISDGEFDIFDKGNSSNFNYGRILVGTVLDRSYVKKVFRLSNQDIEFEELLKKIEALGNPKVLYGYLNMKGEKVIEQKYINAKPFQASRPYTTVSLLKNNKVYSQVIDTIGKVMLEGEYDELNFLNNDFYKAKKRQKWAIVDSHGNLKTQYLFNNLHISHSAKHFIGKNDNEYFYITNEFNIFSLGTANRINVKEFDDNYIYIEKYIKNEGTYNSRMILEVYNLKGNLIVAVENIKSFTNLFNKKPLPVGYLYLEFNEGTQNPCIYDLKRKKIIDN